MSDYTTLQNVKDRLVTTLTTQDDMISRLITDASRAVDQWCNRPNNAFVAQAQVRVYDIGVVQATSIPFTRDATLQQMQAQGTWPSVTVSVVDIDPLLSFSAVKIDQDLNGSFETTMEWMLDFDLWPQNAPADGDPWKRLRLLPSTRYQLPIGLNALQISGMWGDSIDVPEPIRSATELTVIRWFKRPQDALDNTAKGMRQWNPDADVEAILRQGGYIRPWVVV